ncbi:hypothetical protein GUJ93_ZPchr0011g28676 [Zizania palustris]|uniref:Transcription repressor n=1 Tax=Zizania palustris TaxID=103762 RepID=A0A8J5WFE0_ZIZPA|nr:hypothetical protein GUJ93_ZPchr0011g28676 [Zizania palustris]
MTTSSSMATRRSGGGGGRQFPVGRRRHVPVVDSGCGCRLRRPRLLSLSSLLLWPASACKQQTAAAVPEARGVSKYSSPYYFRSSSSAASFSSSSGATHSTGYSAASSYSSRVRQHGAGKKEDVVVKVAKSSSPPSPGKRPPPSRKKKMSTAEDDGGGVGVAVEKESSDPRADFRDSMLQMVVEMGLCHWDDLRCMLRRLLALNAPRHHAAILTAFADVCAQLAAPSSPVYGQHRR